MPRGTYQDCVVIAELDGKMRRTTHKQEDTGKENRSVEVTLAKRVCRVHQIDRRDEEDDVAP